MKQQVIERTKSEAMARTGIVNEVFDAINGFIVHILRSRLDTAESQCWLGCSCDWAVFILFSYSHRAIDGKENVFDLKVVATGRSGLINPGDDIDPAVKAPHGSYTEAEGRHRVLARNTERVLLALS